MTAVDTAESASHAAGDSVPVFYFTGVNNVGDLLNPFLIGRLFGVDAHLAFLRDRPHVIAIGSFIEAANQFSHVWGTGAISAASVIPDIDRNKIHALRGKLSFQLLGSSGARLRDMPLGDPGFLVGSLKDRFATEKKYRLGVIPHYVDRQHPWVQNILTEPDVLDLNVHRPVEEFLRDISACEAVVSSSLHGLVVAEAFDIPNVWIQLSEDVVGSGFKFRDWYSLAERPQNEPELPNDGKSGEIVAELCRTAILHEMKIDAQGLQAAFPLDEVRVPKPVRAVDAPPLADIRGLNPSFFKRSTIGRPQHSVEAKISEGTTQDGTVKLRETSTRLPLFASAPPSAKSPIVSCIMVTANRPAQARVSIECYLRQSWRNRRMVIVDTGTDDSLERWLQENRDPSINYKRIVKGDMTLGDIRNFAIQRARGDYICIWDDDDLHHPLRIEAQMTAIAGSRSTACMLSRLIIWWPFRRRFVVSGGKFWEGTLIARRDTMASFASVDRGEDSYAVRKLRNNERLVYVAVPELYVYVKHLNNTWGDDHFNKMMHSAAAHFSADEHDGVIARLRSVLPIDEYMDAIRL
jgi:hypothetical protein